MHITSRTCSSAQTITAGHACRQQPFSMHTPTSTQQLALNDIKLFAVNRLAQAFCCSFAFWEDLLYICVHGPNRACWCNKACTAMHCSYAHTTTQAVYCNICLRHCNSAYLVRCFNTIVDVKQQNNLERAISSNIALLSALDAIRHDDCMMFCSS